MGLKNFKITELNVHAYSWKLEPINQYFYYILSNSLCTMYIVNSILYGKIFSISSEYMVQLNIRKSSLLKRKNFSRLDFLELLGKIIEHS